MVLSTHLHSDGALLGHLLWRHPGSMNRQFVTPELVGTSDSHPQMKGRELYDLCLTAQLDATWRYLDAVHARVATAARRVTALGFSQGVATVARWIASR